MSMLDNTTPEVVPEATPETPAIDLDTLISKTLDAMDGSEGAPDEAAADDATPGVDRERDELGRFKAREAAPDDGTSAETAESAESTETATNATAAPKWTDGHFRGWSQEERAKFQALTPEAQDLLMAKVQATEAHYKTKDTEFGQFRKSIEPVHNVIQEQRAYFDGIGMAPERAIAALVNTEQTLRYGTYADKVRLFSEMARDYGIPVQISEPDPYAADPTQPGSATYPVIHDLSRQVASLQTQLKSYQSQAEQRSMAQARQAFDEFAAAKNADGSPAYPFLETVKGAMGQLLTDGKASTLAEAYALASQPITDALSAQVKQREEAARKAQAEALAKAKKAAPVRSSGMSPGGKTQAVSLDALIGSALDGAGIH